MTLRGRAFLAIWHDLTSEAEAEYNEWHTVQHMPERVGIPGFRRARRYVDPALAVHRYFTLYEGDELGVFSSEAYRERLGNPTEWTTKLMPFFRNFARSGCETISSTGLGVGGTLATIRIDFDDEADFLTKAMPVLEREGRASGITGVHIGAARPESTKVTTRETELRESTGEEVFDAVVLIEGISREAVSAATAAIEREFGGFLGVSTTAATYDLAYSLDAGES